MMRNGKGISIVIFSKILFIMIFSFSLISPAKTVYAEGKMNIGAICGTDDAYKSFGDLVSLLSKNKLSYWRVNRCIRHYYDCVKRPNTRATIDGILDSAFGDSTLDDINYLYIASHGYSGSNVKDRIVYDDTGIILSTTAGEAGIYKYRDLVTKLCTYKGQFVVILDACFSENFYTVGVQRYNPNNISKFTCLLSTAKNEYAYGALSYQFYSSNMVDALKITSLGSFGDFCSCDTNMDGIVNLRELHDSVKWKEFSSAQTYGTESTPLFQFGSVKLDKTVLTIKCGDNTLHQLKVTRENCSKKRETKWRSSNPEIVSVDSTGILTAKMAGTATITAYLSDDNGNMCLGSESQCKVTVEPYELKSSFVKQATTSYFYTGKTITPTVYVYNQNIRLRNGTDYTVTYSNNKKVGQATIKITGKGNYSGVVKKTFKIKPVLNISPNNKTINIRKIKSFTMKATIKTGTKKKPKVIWKSSNKNVATITSNGKVRLKKKGTTTISATINTSVGKFTKKSKLTVVKKYTRAELQKIANKQVKKKYGKKYVASEFYLSGKYLKFMIRYQGGNTANVLVGAGSIHRDTAKTYFYH